MDFKNDKTALHYSEPTLVKVISAIVTQLKPDPKTYIIYNIYNI